MLHDVPCRIWPQRNDVSRFRSYLLRFPLEQSATENRVRIRKRGGGRREKRRKEQQRLRWDDWMHEDMKEEEEKEEEGRDGDGISDQGQIAQKSGAFPHRAERAQKARK